MNYVVALKYNFNINIRFKLKLGLDIILNVRNEVE